MERSIVWMEMKGLETLEDCESYANCYIALLYINTLNNYNYNRWRINRLR